MPAKFKRRQYLIDLPFQMRLIVRFASMVLVTSFVIGAGVFLLTRTSTTVAIEKTRIFAKPTSDFILPVLTMTVLTVSLTGAIIVMLMMLIISHRIVGPVFRLKKEIDSIKAGHLKRNFTTRQKDQLKDLSKCLQDMSDVLYDRHTDLKKSHESLANFLETEGHSLSESHKEKLGRILEDIQGNIDFFKV